MASHGERETKEIEADSERHETLLRQLKNDLQSLSAKEKTLQDEKKDSLEKISEAGKRVWWEREEAQALARLQLEKLEEGEKWRRWEEYRPHREERLKQEWLTEKRKHEVKIDEHNNDLQKTRKEIEKIEAEIIRQNQKLQKLLQEVGEAMGRKPKKPRLEISRAAESHERAEARRRLPEVRDEISSLRGLIGELKVEIEGLKSVPPAPNLERQDSSGLMKAAKAMSELSFEIESRERKLCESSAKLAASEEEERTLQEKLGTEDARRSPGGEVQQEVWSARGMILQSQSQSQSQSREEEEEGGP